MKDFKPQIQWVNPRDLIPHVNNAKVHSPDQIDQIAGQIHAFGFDQPIVVSKENVIIKGHGRREAAIKLNMLEVPIIVTDLDEYQAMAARIADNAVVSKDYNKDKLKFELGTLKNKGLDLKLTALKPLELKALLPSDAVSKQNFDTVNRETPQIEGEEYQEGEQSTNDGDTNQQAEPEAKSEGYFMDRNPVIQYNVVFDDKSQQDKWHAFIALLKEQYPDIETIAGRIIKFIDENAS